MNNHQMKYSIYIYIINEQIEYFNKFYCKELLLNNFIFSNCKISTTCVFGFWSINSNGHLHNPPIEHLKFYPILQIECNVVIIIIMKHT